MNHPTSQANTRDWNAFVPDAAEALRARDAFEDASAGALEMPFDVRAQSRLKAALAQLQAATPAAHRIARTAEVH